MPIITITAFFILGLAQLFYHFDWRREMRARNAWWRTYEADAIKRHEEFMAAMDSLDDDETTEEES